MNMLFKSCDSDSIIKQDIVLPKDFPAIFISSSNTVFCYTGTLLENETRELNINNYSWKFQEISPTNKIISDNVLGFYRISKGCIIVDSFLDKRVDDIYKLSKAILKLPQVTNNYFGILEQGTFVEDEVLTREVFGLTHSEITDLLGMYAKIFGTCNDYIEYPRLTKSNKRNNFCDMTNLWIPENFPYITFTSGDYKYSHVSLWGFYQHLQILFHKGINTPICQMFLKNGLEETIVEKIFNIDDYEFSSARKMDYAMIYSLKK